MANFLCVVFFIMCQVTVMTTSSPVTTVHSGALSSTMTVTMTPIHVGLVAVGQYDVVLLPPLILRDTMSGVVGLTTAATSITDAFSGLCQLCHWSSSFDFPF